VRDPGLLGEAVSGPTPPTLPAGHGTTTLRVGDAREAKTTLCRHLLGSITAALSRQDPVGLLSGFRPFQRQPHRVEAVCG
jgi:hypothetical protein